MRECGESTSLVYQIKTTYSSIRNEWGKCPTDKQIRRLVREKSPRGLVQAISQTSPKVCQLIQQLALSRGLHIEESVIGREIPTYVDRGCW